MKPIVEYAQFAALDIRVGRIVSVEDARTTKPTYRMTIDFGPEIGTKVSCGAYRRYSKEELVGRQVVAVVNFAPKQMGPERSEVLVLGIDDGKGGTIHLTTANDAPVGGEIF